MFKIIKPEFRLYSVNQLAYLVRKQSGDHSMPVKRS